MSDEKRPTGHQERLGEALADFEFYQAGWPPYNAFIDVDKVDMVLRRRANGSDPEYRDIQVKFGKLYDCGQRWERELFDITSWRFFRRYEFEAQRNTRLYITYVLVHETGYVGDFFIFPVNDFSDLLASAIPSGDERVRFYISRTTEEKPRWVVRRLGRKFSSLDQDTVIDVTRYRRAFDLLE